MAIKEVICVDEKTTITMKDDKAFITVEVPRAMVDAMLYDTVRPTNARKRVNDLRFRWSD